MKQPISLLVVVVYMMTTTALWGQTKPSKSWQKLGEKDSLCITPIKTINSAKDDFSPMFINGILYFTSSRVYRHTDEADLKCNENIYTTRYIDTSWSLPTKFYFFNNDDYTALAGCGSGGSQLFTYKTFGNGDFYSLRRGEKHWSRPKRMKNPINSDSHEQSITEANGIIVFSSDRPGGQGQHDLYSAQINSNGEYTVVPVNMVNSPGDEVDVRFGSDGKTLYFSSNGLENGKGGYDIFFTVLDESGHWQVSKNMGQLINSDADDRYFLNCDSMFFLSSNRAGSTGGDDIVWGRLLEKRSKDTNKLAFIKPRDFNLPKDSVIVHLNDRSIEPVIFLGDKDDSLRNVKLIAIDDTLKKHEFEIYYAQVQIGAYYYLQSIQEFKYNYPAFDTTKIFVEKIQTKKGMLFKYLIDEKYTTLKESAVRQQQAIYQQTDQANRYKIVQGDAFIAVYDKAGQRILIYFNIYTGACRILIGDKTIKF